MKKNSSSSKAKTNAISPDDAIRFLEDVRVMYSEKDEPTEAISLRVPGNILRAIKLKAKADNKKYQSLIVEYLRKGLRER